ncbi:MAG: expansin EXLX1 family cellulose-binding protein [Kineosporiaceae bacterium]
MLFPLAGALRALLALVVALAMTASHGSALSTATHGSTAGSTTASTSSASRSSAARTAAPASARTTLGPVVRGQATHYGPAAPGGNCMFPTVPANKLTVAAGPDLYARGAACGGYLAVTSGSRTIRVKIDNQCPECGRGHIDLSDEAFAALAPLGRGLIPITYRIVTNPPLSRGLSFVVKSGSSRYWLALLVDNAGNRLRSVEVQTGGRWLALSRTDYGYWVANSGAGSGPFTVRVTDVGGHGAVARGIRLAPNAVQQTAVRLYR